MAGGALGVEREAAAAAVFACEMLIRLLVERFDGDGHEWPAAASKPTVSKLRTACRPALRIPSSVSVGCGELAR